MKRTLSAVAAALALVSVSAQAEDVQTSFPDGFSVLSAADLAPRAGAVSEWEIRQHFPKGSFRHHPAMTPQDLAPRADARSTQELLAGFPQPSFQDYPQSIGDVRAIELATTEATSAN